MRNNWVIYLAIFFFIIRLFTSAAKKQAAQAKQSVSDVLQKAIAEQARKNRKSESDKNIRIAAEAVREQTAVKARAKRMTQGSEDFEAAYKSDEYQDVAAVRAPSASKYTDQFGSSSSVNESSYKETAEEAEIYDTKVSPKPRVLGNMNTEAYRQFIIAKEIFDKPKSMR